MWGGGLGGGLGRGDGFIGETVLSHRCVWGCAGGVMGVVVVAR